jgi:5-methylcytosine-specific restriction protein A
MPDEPRRLHRPRAPRNRGTTTERGYGSVWQRFRKAWFAQEPRLCAECARRGRIVPATVADHVRPHKGDPALFWDRENLQGLCASCHSVKTANEDGGFGRPVQEQPTPPPPCGISDLFLRLRNQSLDQNGPQVQHPGQDETGQGEQPDDYSDYY